MQTKKRIFMMLIPGSVLGITLLMIGLLEISRSGPGAARTVRAVCSTTIELTAGILVCRH